MGLWDINLNVNFNPKTRKVKRLKLEKLSKPIADFVRYLNFVFSKTPYAVGFVNEQRYKPNGFIKRLITGIEEEEDKLRVDFTLYNKGQKPIPTFEGGLGYLTIDFDEDTTQKDCQVELFEFECPRGIRNYENQIKNYDLTEIFEYYLNS